MPRHSRMMDGSSSMGARLPMSISSFSENEFSKCSRANAFCRRERYSQIALVVIISFFFLCARRDHRCHRMKCNNRTNGWQERQKCQCLWILFENGENDKLLFISSNHAIAVSRLKANRRHSDCIIFDIYSIPHRPQSETAQAREMSDARCISVIDGFRPKWITSKWYFCKRLHLCNPRDALRSRTCVCVLCLPAWIIVAHNFRSFETSLSSSSLHCRHHGQHMRQFQTRSNTISLSIFILLLSFEGFFVVSMSLEIA